MRIAPIVGLTLICAIGLGSSQEPNNFVQGERDRVVSSQRYGAMTNELFLSVHQKDTGKQSTAARLRYLTQTKPVAGAESNQLDYLVLGEVPSQSGKVIWLIYRALSASLRPQPKFTVGIGSSEEEGKVEVVTAASTGSNTIFSYYRADTTKTIADFPLRLDPERKEEWPAPSKPQSEMTYTGRANDGCEVDSLSVTVVQGSISIKAGRGAACPALVVAFEPKTAKWSYVALEVKAEDRNQ